MAQAYAQNVAQPSRRVHPDATSPDSEAAWGELFDAHYPQLYRYFYAHLDSHEQSEDLAAEVFADAWRTRGSLRWRDRSFEAWLFKHARKRLDEYQDAQRGEALHADSSAQVEDAPVWDDYVAVEVREQLSRLKPDYRTALELRYLMGLSGAEAAAAMGRSHGAFRALLLRAVEAFRQEIERERRTHGGD